MPKRPPARVIDPAARELATQVSREVRARCAANSTFEERQDMAALVMQEVLAGLAAADTKLEN